MTTADALRTLRERIAQGDPAAIEAALVEAERIAAVVPEVAVYMDGGLVQEVRRANEAPFVLHVHDHDVEGTTNAVCELTWPDGSTEDAIISTYTEKDDAPIESDAYWNSLREPVVVQDADDHADADDDDKED